MGTTITPPSVGPLARIKYGNEVKVARRALMERMYLMPAHDSCLFAVDLLADLPEVLRNMPVLKFVESIRFNNVRNGRPPKARARKGETIHRRDVLNLLESSEIYGHVRLCELTVAQRHAMSAILRMRAQRGGAL